MSPDQTNNLLQLHLLDTVPLWALYIGSVVILLLASEVGYRLSKTMQRRRPDKAEASVGALSGATLALLAFLLAFVTSTAVNSLAARRQSLIDEANAVGTAYLRAGYLAEPTATESRQLLREYVDQRLAARDRTRVAQAISRSEEIHSIYLH